MSTKTLRDRPEPVPLTLLRHKTSLLSSRPSHAKRGAEPGPIATELSRGCGVWVPALRASRWAGTTKNISHELRIMAPPGFADALLETRHVACPFSAPALEAGDASAAQQGFELRRRQRSAIEEA